MYQNNSYKNTLQDHLSCTYYQKSIFICLKKKNKLHDWHTNLENILLKDQSGDLENESSWFWA